MQESHINTGVTQSDIDILKTFIGKRLIKMYHKKYNGSPTAICILRIQHRLLPMSSAIRYFDTEVKGVACLYIQEGENP